jgi:hypothetical protein
MAQQPARKELAAKKTAAAIKIDGLIDEAAWMEVAPATDFVEWRPNAGVLENAGNKTVVYLLYDNTSIYIGGYCYERTKDSVSRELIGRDKVGVNDFVGVIFDTYNDKINGFGFYVTPYGEQYDAKYSSTSGEDDSWNGVWDSEAKMHENGWSFEMRIPYSALRFVSSNNQTWGLNITRRRNKTGQQYMWNPVDPKVNGFVNQEGLWTGIEKIVAPLRLSFSPYFSTYVNHYPNKTAGIKDVTSSVNGGMDVKYGITDAFTLDMTLIPDFGQVQSDNQVLNVSPFEVKYNENRAFFTEGTELFNKGDLFYSRRIGSTPIHYWDVNGQLNANESLLKNPSESKLINATKISGRTKKGLGIGVFNAITKTMYAEVEDNEKHKREIETGPLTNYNILVFDQTLKNNSSVSFINTNVLRSGKDYDANVSAALFDFNNKKNTYNWNGKFSVSHITSPGAKGSTGYSHRVGLGKTGGRFNFNLTQEIADEKYDINDMGILFNNNYIDHYLWAGYRWLKPGKWYNRINLNYNAGVSSLYQKFNNQVITSKFQRFNTNVNADVQLKNLWFVGAFAGYVPVANDFYEPRMEGRSFKSPSKLQLEAWFETNSAKKYYFGADYFVGLRNQFNSKNHEIRAWHRYRFGDKLSVSQNFYFNPFSNDAGFYFPKDAAGNRIIINDIVFTRRNRTTIENILSVKYNFNNKSGITFRARHYWSKVEQKDLYDLQMNGDLSPSVHAGAVSLFDINQNYFNIDAVYTWQFAPGSFVNIVWKNSITGYDDAVQYSYFKNFSNTVSGTQNNNLSLKVIYFLDYLNIRKWKSKS